MKNLSFVGLHLVSFLWLLHDGVGLAGEVTAAGAKLEKLASGFETVEGPVYDGKGTLFFTDIPNNKIYQHALVLWLVLSSISAGVGWGEAHEKLSLFDRKRTAGGLTWPAEC